MTEYEYVDDDDFRKYELKSIHNLEQLQAQFRDLIHEMITPENAENWFNHLYVLRLLFDGGHPNADEILEWFFSMLKKDTHLMTVTMGAAFFGLSVAAEGKLHLIVDSK